MPCLEQEVGIGFTRRKFLKALGGVSLDLALKSLVPPLETAVVPSKEYLSTLEPNENISLSGLFMIPESLFKHTRREMVSTAVNFGKMYKRDTNESMDHVNRYGKDGDIYGYGGGIREAIKRGQKVFLVIEFPGMTDTDVTVDDWKLYVSGLSLDYMNCPYFILGNEINFDGQKHWKDNPSRFVDYYIAAYESIKKISPKSKVLMYGDAYFGKGEILTKVLTEIKKRFLDRMPVDGLTFHFYDRISLLRKRIEDPYLKLGQEFNIPDLYLTELGKLETLDLSPEETRSAVIQGTSTALSLIPQNIKDAFWYTAYAVSPHNHSLSYYDEKGELKLSSAFDSFWEISKLLHHGIETDFDYQGISTIKGRSSNNDTTVVMWNSTFIPGNIDFSSYQGNLLRPSNKKDLEGSPLILFYPRRYSFPRIFNF